VVYVSVTGYQQNIYAVPAYVFYIGCGHG
jgi:hypothetical protein